MKRKIIDDRTAGKVPSPKSEVSELDMAWRIGLIGIDREVVGVGIGKVCGGSRDGQLTLVLEMRGTAPDIAVELDPDITMQLGIAAISLVAGPPEVVDLR